MDLRTHYPFSLLKNGLQRSYPSLDRNLKTDVAIIGAGITGALVAYHLQKAGIDCVILDKRHAGMGSTAASTSLIQYEIDKPLHELVEKLGEKNAVRSYQLCHQAISDIKSISKKIGDRKNFQDKCSLQYASYKKHVDGLEKEYKLRKQFGFHVDLLSEKEIKKDFGFEAPAGLYSYDAGQLDAYLFTHDLLAHVERKDKILYDHTEVTEIKHEKNKIRLVTQDGFTVNAKRLVIACGYESGKYADKKLEQLQCTFALVSEPLPSQELWKSNCLIWETADPYLYIRTTNDNRILMGGKDIDFVNLEKQLELLPAKTKSLENSFQKLFPHIPFKTDFKWAGAFATTKDGLPYIGQIPGKANTYFALGYGGNGITFSLLAAQMITRAIQGKKDPDMEIFSFNR